MAYNPYLTQIDTNITGSLTATDALGGTPAGNGVLIATAPTAGSFVAALVPGGSAQLDIQITGTATGTYYFEASMDSTNGSDGNWIVTNYRQTGIINTVLGYSANAMGVYRGAPSGFKYVRVRNVGGTTPTNAMIFRYSNGSGTTFLNASIPAGTNSIGTVGANSATGSAKPANAFLMGGSDGTNLQPIAVSTTGQVSVRLQDTFGNGLSQQTPSDALAGAPTTIIGATSYGLLFDGTNFFRARGNNNTTTGDTGAKTATFNGATQTNYNAKGATILINMGAVSGTTPTLTAQVQGSADSGTTWYNIPGAVTPSITATGTTVLTVYPGATVAANAAVSYPLPRTWRLVYTIGGTTPSFTITNVQVASVL